MSALPEVTEVQRLRLEPGDRIVVTIDDTYRLTPDDAIEIKRRVQAALDLPADVPVLLLGGGHSLKVINAGGVPG